MIVVPVEKDYIKTKDGLGTRVISYTNFKEGGPAVYCKNRGDGRQTLVYFFDIDEINGTKVEYSKNSRMFNALGKINREQHLPQPDDKVVVVSGGEKITVEVASLKLKSKLLGINKGIFIKDKNGVAHRLRNIIDIESAIGGRRFNRKAFLSFYDEYLGV
jgi:hypothetical protein